MLLIFAFPHFDFTVTFLDQTVEPVIVVCWSRSGRVSKKDITPTYNESNLFDEHLLIDRLKDIIKTFTSPGSWIVAYHMDHGNYLRSIYRIVSC